MDHFDKLLNILFKTSCENSETKPHSDGIFILGELKSYLNQFGIETVIQEYKKVYEGKTYTHANLIAKKIGSTGPYIALQGHIDTVPCNEEYKYTVTDTEIIGRGATDMKGPLIGIIMSFLSALQNGNENVLLIITDDEETDFAGIEELIGEKDTLLPKIKFCINAESTNLLPSFLTRGFGQYEIYTEGYTAHSSSSKNDFLIENMSSIIASVNSYLTEVRKISDPIYGNTRAAFTMLNSGTKTNQLPANFHLVFNMRLVTADLNKYKDLFDKMIRPLCTENIKITELFFEPFESTVDHDVKENLMSVFKENNLAYSEAIMHAFTESYMFNKAGIPCFTWGPGDLDLAHVVPADETIKIEDIRLYSRLLTDLLLKSK